MAFTGHSDKVLTGKNNNRRGYHMQRPLIAFTLLFATQLRHDDPSLANRR